MSRTKANSTPEAWAKYLAYQREYAKNHYHRSDEYRSKKLAAASTPEAKAKRRAVDHTPEAIARRKAHAATDAAKQKERERVAKIKSDPVKWAARLESQRMRRTGFDKALIDKTAAIQGNACALCLRAFNGAADMKADHCHQSLKPRGLLCHGCNIAEGMICKSGVDVLEWAQRLVDYLKNPPASKG